MSDSSAWLHPTIVGLRQAEGLYAACQGVAVAVRATRFYRDEDPK